MAGALRQQFARVRRIQEARRTLVANLSHDLRAPLTSILGYAETLQHRSGDGSGDVNRYATIIAQRARYMDRLLDHLLEASLLDQPVDKLKTRPCNVCLLVEQAVVEYALVLEERHIRTDLQLPSHPIWLDINDWSIQQVIRNLIDNAIAYGGDGGYLGVRVTETPGAVLIAVSDRGRGIPQGELESVFEPFHRVDAADGTRHTGVGLALARELVAMHNGRIWVESQPFVSTVFTIALPRGTGGQPAR